MVCQFDDFVKAVPFHVPTYVPPFHPYTMNLYPDAQDTVFIASLIYDVLMRVVDEAVAPVDEL